ncbi:hypothetical protein ES703_123524 [subsurface metagenome]
MKVTFVPETYSASPKTVSVPMSQKDEQELMDMVGIAQVALLFKAIWDVASKG